MLLVFVEAQRLVIADGERDLFRNIRLVHLRAPPAVIHLDEILHRVVQQARQHDLLGHAVLHGAIGALQAVVGGGHESQLIEIHQRGPFRHRRQLLHVARMGDEQIPGAAASGTRFDLRLHFGRGRKLRRLVGLISNVELQHHVMLERLGLGFVGHCGNRRHSAESRKKCPPVDFHVFPPFRRLLRKHIATQLPLLR